MKVIRISEKEVLILVLMEDALRVLLHNRKTDNVLMCLNPCSNGRCSASA